MDLRHVMWGPNALGVRRLVALLDGLPRGSAFHRALDPNGWDWTTDREISAETLEVLDDFRKMYLRTHTEKGTKIADPIKFPRPWDDHSRPTQAKPQRRAATKTEMQTFFKKTAVAKPKES